jgi:hypothetical protein
LERAVPAEAQGAFERTCYRRSSCVSPPQRRRRRAVPGRRPGIRRLAQINYWHLKTDAGFGFRFNVRDSVFLRIDPGFCREGFQV